MSETLPNTSQTDDGAALDADLDAAWEELAGADSEGETSGAPDDGAGEAAQTESPAGEETPADQELGADRSEDEPGEAASETDASSQAGETVDIPSDMNAEEKAAFEKLTPEAKALVASYAKRSQTSRADAANELDRLKSTFLPIGEALKPYQPHLDAMGVDPAQVVTNLMPYYYSLTAGDDGIRRQTIEKLAKDFNVQLSAPQTTEDQEYVEPEIADLRNQVKELKGELSKFTQTAQQRDQASLKAEYDAFVNAKDEKGEPKHPHFEKLRSAMSGLLKGGLAKDYADAYDKAKALDPEIQAAEQKAKEAAAAEAKRKADDAAAKEAKKAAEANKKGGKTPAKPNGSLSIDDAVSEAFDELYG